MNNLFYGLALVALGLIAIAVMPGRDHTGSLFCIVIGVVIVHNSLAR